MYILCESHYSITLVTENLITTVEQMAVRTRHYLCPLGPSYSMMNVLERKYMESSCCSIDIRSFGNQCNESHLPNFTICTFWRLQSITAQSSRALPSDHNSSPDLAAYVRRPPWPFFSIKILIVFWEYFFSHRDHFSWRTKDKRLSRL